MVTVKFYKTINGRDTLQVVREFETIEEAMDAVDYWEEDQSANCYAVYSK